MSPAPMSACACTGRRRRAVAPALARLLLAIAIAAQARPLAAAEEAAALSASTLSSEPESSDAAPAGVSVAPADAGASTDAPAGTRKPDTAVRRPGSRLDTRVQLLAKELDLDARQQAQVRQLLMAQRADILRAWQDPAVPAERRIALTQVISERTADRIRDLLNEPQKEKYNKVRQAERGDSPRPKVEPWMSAILGK